MAKKSFLSLLLAALMLFSVCVSAMAADDTPYGADAYSFLQYLDANLRERRAGTDQEKKAAELIESILDEAGYDAEIVPFSYTRGSTVTNSQNVVAVKPGRSEKQIIVGAHYDSVGTAGVDDNGSGTSVALETAVRMYGIDTPYTIVFVFFGAEETGLRGSAAYADAMTDEELANTLCMINLDSILAGTYRYMYSGDAVEDADGNITVEKTWPFEQAMVISEEFGLDMHSNDTELNIDYPSPSTGSWSDHQSFRNKGLPYLYFEAANWELPDSPNHPEYGSSGAYETEIGEVMHTSRDDLTFIETQWGTRGRDTVAAYAKLLEQAVQRLNPDGLFAGKDALRDAIEAAKAAECSLLSEDEKAAFEAEIAEAEAVLASDTYYVEDQADIDAVTAGLNEATAKADAKAIIASAPETVACGEDFTFEVTATTDVIGFIVENENGKAVTIKSAVYTEAGSLNSWTISMNVGTAGERTLNVIPVTAEDGRCTPCELTFSIPVNDSGIISADFAKAAVAVNAPVELNVTSGATVSRNSITSDSGRNMGKQLVSRVMNSDGTVDWVYTMTIGTAGANREFDVTPTFTSGAQGDPYTVYIIVV